MIGLVLLLFFFVSKLSVVVRITTERFAMEFDVFVFSVVYKFLKFVVELLFLFVMMFFRFLMCLFSMYLLFMKWYAFALNFFNVVGLWCGCLLGL